MEDFNARTESTMTDKVDGPHEENGINNNGERIIDSCLLNKLKLATGHYEQKNVHKYTKTQPTSQLKTIMDYIISGKQHHFQHWIQQYIVEQIVDLITIY